MNDKNEHWGLNALGIEAPFEVSLHERIDGDKWELEISCGATTIAVHLDSPAEVTLMLAFMTENYGKTKCRPAKEAEHPGIPPGTELFSEVAAMKIKASGEAEACVTKDGEFRDRFFFSVLGNGFRFNARLHDPEASKLISALKKAAADMTSG
jgi:hypothetical protein